MNYHSLKMKDIHRIKTKRGIKISYLVKKIDLIRLLEKDNEVRGLNKLQQREEYDRMIREDEEREIEMRKIRERKEREFRERGERERRENEALESPESKKLRERERREKLKFFQEEFRRENERIMAEQELFRAFMEAGWTVGRLGGRDRGLIRD